MKSTIKFCLVILLLSSCTQKICKDPVACKEVENKLMVIKNSVDKKSLDPCPNVVDYLTVLTNIDSESPGNDIGQGYPTAKDYKKWLNWYENNKDKLYWDKKTQKVIVKK